MVILTISRLNDYKNLKAPLRRAPDPKKEGRNPGIGSPRQSAANEMRHAFGESRRRCRGGRNPRQF